MAIEVTGVAQQRAWGEHVLPPVEQVRPGLWSIPVPIPDNPLRYVLSYCFETSQGPVVVDPGWPTDAGVEALTQGLAAVGSNIESIHGLLLTHAHLDHHGLANMVRSMTGCWVAMHPAEEEHVARLRDVGALDAMNERWLSVCGVPSFELADAIWDPHEISSRAGIVPDILIEDGEDARVPGWSVKAIWTPGHTPGHLCFVVGEADVVLTGDHVLPRITSNISSYYEDDKPLDPYLASLERMREYDSREALPGHEYRFRGLDYRVSAIQSHHAARLDELLALIVDRPASTTWQLSSWLSWSRPWPEVTGFLRRAAVAETLAHLRSLRVSGLVTASEQVPWRWTRGAAADASSGVSNDVSKEEG